MVTSKSTVLGLRLDHDRRAWVEAEATRRGISVRALFEGFIDGAQAGEVTEGASRAAGDLLTSATASDEVRDGSPSTPGVHTSPWSDIGSVTALPGRLIRRACLFPIDVIKSSGRCAQKRLEGCPAVKSWGGRAA
jgi:hypothetical protein